MRGADLTTLMNISKPRRAARTYVQHLVAAPDMVFPLLCPVREADWLEGWDPLLVLSQSGVAEPDCVFVTAGEPASAVWYITRHEPDNGLVEMLKITPGVTACRIKIRLRPSAAGTEAQITYIHTSLGPAGDAFVAAFTDEYYLQFMRNWETRINHFLAHGSRLHGAGS